MTVTAEVLSKGSLSHVTPSIWLNLRQCAWRVLLARHFQNNPLLPIHPNATLGSILHAALEKITKGELRAREDFDRWWDEKVKKAEQDLESKGWGQFVPLKENTHHFGLKKVQVRNRLLLLQGRQSIVTKTFSKIVEQKLATTDGLLVGRLDCIIWRDGQAEIKDYKTGIITIDEDGEETALRIKEEYELQMKLYACLFKENYGNYPVRLILEDLNGMEYEVRFTPKECARLLEEIKSSLITIKQQIAKNKWEELANIGDYCSFCNYRPACNKYLSLLKTVLALPNKGWHDLSGTLVNIEENGTSRAGIQIQQTDRLVRITGFDIGKREKLNKLANQRIAIFNVKQVDTQKFTCTKFTEFYAI